MKKTPSFTDTVRLAALPLILVCAFLLRLGLAPMEGFDFDISVTEGWARSAVELGLARSYSEQVGGNMLPNYPPFSLMLFAAAGYLYRSVLSEGEDTSLLAHRMIIKFPAIIADVLLCLLFAVLVGRWRGRWQGLLAAAIFALHPAAIYESAIWGQTDSIFTLFIVGALVAFLWEAPGLSGALITLALLTKVQTVAVLPLFLVFFLLRPRWILSGAIGSFTTLIVVLLPFAIGGALKDIWNVYIGSVGYYPIVSSAAYNFWWSLLADSAWDTPDTTLLFGTISYRTAGFLITAAIAALLLWFHRKNLRTRQPWGQELVVLFLLASTLAFSFFLFETQMHERYLFPFIALSFPIAFLSLQGAVLYGCISFLFFMNLLGFLPLTPVERALHETFPSLDVFLASAQVFLFLLYMRLTLLYRQKKQLATVPAASRPGSRPWGTLSRLHPAIRHYLGIPRA